MTAVGKSVKVYIYDLSKGMARTMSQAFFGKQINGIWHTGIVVYGKEFYYGGTGGIECCPPGGTILGQPDSIHNLGETQIPYEMFIDYLEDLSQSSYRPDRYHLLEHNCNTFSSDVAQFLTGNDIPSQITGLPAEVLATPFGQMIKPFIDSMSVQPSGGSAVFPGGGGSSTQQTQQKNSQPAQPTQARTEPKPQTTARNDHSEFKPFIYDKEPPAQVNGEDLGLSNIECLHLKEIYEYLNTTDNMWSPAREHLNLLIRLVFESQCTHKETILNVLSKLVIKEDIVHAFQHDPKSSFHQLIEKYEDGSVEAKEGIFKVLTNCCSLTNGCKLCLGEKLQKSFSSICVSGLLDDNKQVTSCSAALCYNVVLSKTKISDDMELEIGSALLTACNKELDEQTGIIIYPLPDHTILDWSKLKEFADDNCNFIEIEKGVVQLADLKCDDHTNYEHSTSTNDFQEAISSVLEEDLLHKVKESGKFSLMFDESTDISVHQNLISYIRILETSPLGLTEPNTYYLSIDSLSRANAESIYHKVCEMLDKKGISISGLCSVSTDGASVMVGSRTGVVTRLREDVPGLLATHCIAHRLALSCCSAADSIPYLVKVQDILNSSYKYFHNSPKNMAMLESVQSISGGKFTKFKEVFHTRWLSFQGSVDAMVSNFSSLVSVFLEERSGKALSLHKPVTCYKFLYVVHFLADVLMPLSNLSRSYQRSDLDYSEVTPLLMHASDSLKKLEANRNGLNLLSFLSEVPAEPELDTDGLMTFSFKGHTIRDSSAQREEAVKICSTFVEKLLVSLGDRFSANRDSSILTAMSNYFNPRIESISMQDDLDLLEEYMFKLGFVGCREELDLFQGFGDSLVKCGSKTVTCSRDTASLAIRKVDLYPSVSELAIRFLVAPVSTVDCERGFSRQNIIKSCLRNSMNVSTLDRLMRISLDGPELREFPFHKAFGKWALAKNRPILH